MVCKSTSALLCPTFVYYSWALLLQMSKITYSECKIGNFSENVIKYYYCCYLHFVNNNMLLLYVFLMAYTWNFFGSLSAVLHFCNV